MHDRHHDAPRRRVRQRLRPMHGLESLTFQCLAIGLIHT
jgi:hypothetical protein